MTAVDVQRRSPEPPNLHGLLPLANPLRALALAVVLTALLGLAPSAGAASTLSQNWAGYAVHGTNFQRVSARWRQPRPVCPAGQTRYSAMWTGLGGYSLTSEAVEQVGTELDCHQGHATSSAWYELVPGPSHTLSIGVRPGDLIAANVSAVGGRVTVAIKNLTRHRSFLRTFTPSTLDVSSAEWILEAPSSCVSGTVFCRTLPLTDFNQASFSNTRAQAASGTVGGIVSSAWQRTEIVLGPGGTQFVGGGLSGTSVGTARPGGVTGSGTSFAITYHQQAGQTPELYGERMPSGRQVIVHPRRS